MRLPALPTVETGALSSGPGARDEHRALHATALNTLGMVLALQVRLVESKACYEQALAIRQVDMAELRIEGFVERCERVFYVKVDDAAQVGHVLAEFAPQSGRERADLD